MEVFMKKNINIYIDEIKIGEIYSEYSDLLIVGCDDIICPLESDCDKCIFNNGNIYRTEDLRNRFK